MVTGESMICALGWGSFLHDQWFNQLHSAAQTGALINFFGIKFFQASRVLESEASDRLCPQAIASCDLVQIEMITMIEFYLKLYRCKWDQEIVRSMMQLNSLVRRPANLAHLVCVIRISSVLVIAPVSRSLFIQHNQRNFRYGTIQRRVLPSSWCERIRQVAVVGSALRKGLPIGALYLFSFSSVILWVPREPLIVSCIRLSLSLSLHHTQDTNWEKFSYTILWFCREHRVLTVHSPSQLSSEFSCIQGLFNSFSSSWMRSHMFRLHSSTGSSQLHLFPRQLRIFCSWNIFIFPTAEGQVSN